MELKRVRKVFFAWNVEKEMAFLEQQARMGWHLVRVRAGAYDFERGKPADMVYASDFRPMRKKDEDDYLDILQDWEKVCVAHGWNVFRKKRTGTGDALFSDQADHRAMLVRLLVIVAVTGGPLWTSSLLILPAYVRNNGSSFLTDAFQVLLVPLLLIHVWFVGRIVHRLVMTGRSVSE